MNAFLFGCCWKISRASCGIPIVICFAMVLGRPAPFLAPPLDFLLGVSWMLFILFVFLQCSLKSMGWGFRPFPFALRAFRPFCAFAIWTLRWDLVQLRNRKYRLNTLLLLLRVQLATTYALGWVAVILKGVDFVADSVKFLSISWRILWNSCRFSDGFRENRYICTVQNTLIWNKFSKER